MDRTYRKWRQTDTCFNRLQAWPAQQFPLAEHHMFRDCGCLVCSLAVMLRHHNIEKTADENQFNPWILNRRLIDCGAFSPEADLELEDIRKLYPLEYLGALPYSREELMRIAEKSFPCLITVPGKNSENHFLALYQVLDDDAAVYDPLCGERKLSSYEKVREIRVFRGLTDCMTP